MPFDVNPFEAAVTAGVPEDDMLRLAIVVRVAHTDSGVWTGCRLDFAMRAWRETKPAPSLAGYLDGHHFAAFHPFADGTLVQLETLREHAYSFLEKRSA